MGTASTAVPTQHVAAAAGVIPPAICISQADCVKSRIERIPVRRMTR